MERRTGKPPVYSLERILKAAFLCIDMGSTDGLRHFEIIR